MNLTRHCELCDHEKKDFKIGTTCGLTNRKPEFHKTCAKIKLTDKFEHKLKSVNIEYENFERKKNLTYVYFVLFILIGIAVIITGYMLGKYAFESGAISTVPIIIMGVGLVPLGIAFGTLSKYRQDIGSAKYNKERIDKVLNEYGIEYDIKVTFGKEIHGTQEVNTDLIIQGIR